MIASYLNTAPDCLRNITFYCVVVYLLKLDTKKDGISYNLTIFKIFIEERAFVMQITSQPELFPTSSYYTRFCYISAIIS